MTRSQLLAAAEKELGAPVTVSRLNYALRMGYVTVAETRPDGWHIYSKKSLAELVSYMRNRSRSTVPASVK